MLLKKPGLLSLGGGLPCPENFPFEEISMKVPKPPHFSEQETKENGQLVRTGKYDASEGKSVYDLSIALVSTLEDCLFDNFCMTVLQMCWVHALIELWFRKWFSSNDTVWKAHSWLKYITNEILHLDSSLNILRLSANPPTKTGPVHWVSEVQVHWSKHSVSFVSEGITFCRKNTHLPPQSRQQLLLELECLELGSMTKVSFRKVLTIF